MLKGVPLGEGWRRERLLDAQRLEDEREVKRTLFLVSAMQENNESLRATWDDYIESVIPSEKEREAFVEDNLEILEQQQVLEVKKTDGP